jgi:hypothetical protein
MKRGDEGGSRRSAVRARGWTNQAAFARDGTNGSKRKGALRVVVLNTESGTGGDASDQRSLLAAAVQRAGESTPSVIITPAGFYGCAIDADGEPRWHGVARVASLRDELVELAASWPSSLRVAVGVDVACDDQRQWWLAGGRRERPLEIRRGAERSSIAERRISHAGFTLLGFVCGECYEWEKRELASALTDVAVVAVSAHVEVNRIWKRRIDPKRKRWSFHRRFRFISTYAGAALAHVRGADDRYVRNCDDWFVHRGGEPFPGPRVGVPVRA